MQSGTYRAEDVLVTGGSGYLGSRIIVTLLEQGFHVRTTVRGPAREKELRAMIASELGTSAPLSVHVADLLKDGGWAEAMEGTTHVIHPASPMPAGEFKGKDLLTPARAGTKRVLQAATDAGVKRVVLTSSALAALPSLESSASIDEGLWTERPDTPAFAYARAKTLAEQAAWSFVKSRPNAPELTTILPGLIQGPVLGADYSASVDLVAQMLGGKMPMAPRVGFIVVDARDVADLHVRAMLAPEAAGERLLATGDFLWLTEFADVLKQRFGARANKVPKRSMPDWLVRTLAVFNEDLASLVPDLGREWTADSAKAKRLLGWQTRPAVESVADAAASLLAKGLA
jgi:dihydroflavonol-4-reductase